MTGAIRLLATLAAVVAAVGLALLVVAIVQRSRRSTWSTEIATTVSLERSLGAAAIPRAKDSDSGSGPEPTKVEPLAVGTVGPKDHRLLAPIELRFVGESSVVGVRADTETAAAFQRAADELTDGMMDYHDVGRARSSSGAESVRGVERGAGI